MPYLIKVIISKLINRAIPTPIPTRNCARNVRDKLCEGFTLIELIITVSILAVLVTIVVVALNPAEQLARSRDTKRVSDLDALRSAINLYLAQASGTVNFTSDSTANSRCIGGGGTTTFFVNTAAGVFSPTGTGFSAVSTSTGQLIATSTSWTGAATWMPVLLGNTPSGAAVAQLPLDPTNGTGNSTSFYYGFGCNKTALTYELTARLESTYYVSGLSIPSTDGGNSSSTYEVGTDLTIVSAGY